jgi:FkbM family methyltransferase
MAASIETATFGALAPGQFDRAVIALTSRLPNNWLGLRLAILLRRFVTVRLAHPDGALDVVRWGLRLRLHPRDNGCEKNLLFTPQMYETTELAELTAEIARAARRRASFVFVDIGANVGLFSFFVATCAGPSACVLAVEPEKGNLERFFFNMRANPGLPIRIVSAAVAGEAGTLAVEPDRRDRGGTRVHQSAQSGEVTVEAKTLLQLMTQEGLEWVDALKIDVEGMEDSILSSFFRDAPQRLWPRFILVEDARAVWNTDLFSLLAATGYSVASRSRQNVMLRSRQSV